MPHLLTLGRVLKTGGVSVLAMLVVLYFLVYSSLFQSNPLSEGQSLNASSSIQPNPHPNPPRRLTKQTQEARVAIGVPGLAKASELDCDQLINGNWSYIGEYKTRRVSLNGEPPELDTSCQAIRARWDFHRDNHTTHGEERGFPLAFARTVFQDYLLLEQMLSVEYEPWNYYCYALDSKASPLFKSRVRQLAKCFGGNVAVASVEYAVYSNGKNVSRSHLACLEQLLHMGSDWEYAMVLQVGGCRRMVEILKFRVLKNLLLSIKFNPCS